MSPAFLRPGHPDADQASGLRQLFARHRAQVVALTSAPTVPLRSTLLADAAAALAANRQRVLLVDENPFPRSASARLISAVGQMPPDLLQVMRAEVPLEKAFCRIGESALDLLAASRLAQADMPRSRRLAEIMQGIEAHYDHVLIDCSTARPAQLSALAEQAYHLVVAVGTDSRGITQAYAQIKRLSQTYGRSQLHILVLGEGSRDEARMTFSKLRQVANEHLGLRLNYLGAAMPEQGAALATLLDSGLPRRPLEGAGGDLSIAFQGA